MIFRLQKIAFYADQLIIQKWKLDFSITKPFKYQFEAGFLIKSGYYIVHSPSTALVQIFCATKIGRWAKFLWPAQNI